MVHNQRAQRLFKQAKARRHEITGDEFVSCLHKRSFTSERIALREAAAYDKYFRAYHCPYCKKWHLTSKEKYGK